VYIYIYIYILTLIDFAVYEEVEMDTSQNMNEFNDEFGSFVK